MTTELCIAASDLDALRAAFFPSVEERCAVLFTSAGRRSNGQQRLLVREVVLPALADYLRQTVDGAELSPAYVARIAKKALLGGLSVVFVHTHPGPLRPMFSLIDSRGEQALIQFLTVRGVKGPHAAWVMSLGGSRVRLLGTNEDVRVVSVGTKRVVEFDPALDELDYPPAFDRQVRAFGAAGQQQLKRLRVGIVGLGGTGSIAAQQLVHLGIERFLLIDPDVIEETNLNRVVGTTRMDIGSPKVLAAERYLKAFDGAVSAAPVVGDVVRDSIARRLIDADVIFCCTDSHGSRSVVQQVAYQYLIPCIDMGSTITQQNGHITGIFGRVQLLAPGLPCLWCSELLDAGQVRRDMMSESERRLDPYIVGGREPAPSVISLNATVVSLAVSMLLGIVAGAPIDATQVIYNARAPSLRSVNRLPRPDCFICSTTGTLGRGDSRPLFTRHD